MCIPQLGSGTVKIPMFCHSCHNEWDIEYSNVGDSMSLDIKVEKINDTSCVDGLAELLSNEKSPPADLMLQIAVLIRKTGRTIPGLYI